MPTTDNITQHNVTNLETFTGRPCTFRFTEKRKVDNANVPRREWQFLLDINPPAGRDYNETSEFNALRESVPFITAMAKGNVGVQNLNTSGGTTFDVNYFNLINLSPPPSRVPHDLDRVGVFFTHLDHRFHVTLIDVNDNLFLPSALDDFWLGVFARLRTIVPSLPQYLPIAGNDTNTGEGDPQLLRDSIQKALNVYDGN